MITYRLANESDYERINSFFNRVNQLERTMEQFLWEFVNGPDGKAIYIIGEEENQIVGTNCVIPIRVKTADGKILLTGKSEDTLVDPAFRGKGIFNDLYQYLFEKCKENGIVSIWGFTSAKKPFSKLGFDIPFDHQQSLAVLNINKSYRYLASLNPKNSFIDKLKIRGLCVLSKLKLSFNSATQSKKFTYTEGKTIVNEVESLVDSNLGLIANLFSIHQTSSFQEWRIYSNPNFSQVFTFSMTDLSGKLVGLAVLNKHTNGVAYFCQNTFHPSLSIEDKTQFVRWLTQQMKKNGAIALRNWHFDFNEVVQSELSVFKSARFVHLKRGVGFVWKQMGDTVLDPKDFYLNRIATEGVI